MTLIDDPDAGLFRTIAKAFVSEDGHTLVTAYLPTSLEGYRLSTDQEALCSAQDAFNRRTNTPVRAERILVRDVDDAAYAVTAPMTVIDDHDPADPVRMAHASIDMSQASKNQRRAAAALLITRAEAAYP